MKQSLDRFILGFPVLFLKQYPYAWIAAVALWRWPPTVSGIFIIIILIGISMLYWQSRAWISNLRREHAFAGVRFHVDEPAIAPAKFTQRFLILLVGSGLFAWLLNGRLGLNFWQLFLMAAGFTLFYYDTRFFGAATTYVITDEGIGIRFVPGHIDYRLFLSFKEILRVEQREYRQDEHWDLFAPSRDTKNGLLLVPKSMNGFTKRIDKLFIAPKDPEKFLEQLPQGYVREPVR
jgi:hypothetical protein